jgi:hypothetical protein
MLLAFVTFQVTVWQVFAPRTLVVGCQREAYEGDAGYFALVLPVAHALVADAEVEAETCIVYPKRQEGRQ